MHFGVLLALLFLSLMDGADCNKIVKGKRQKRRSIEVSLVCTKGCMKCSESNGCLQCSPKLFILLERNDIRQIGICLPSCPEGYFGVRNPDMMNKCIRCKIDNCEACFSRNFCTKCKDGLYLHKGRCYSSCPEGFASVNGTMECSSSAQCEMSEWGPWGPCSKKRKTCGFKKGKEERSRTILQAPAGDTSVCPSITESRKCTMQKVPCPGGTGERNRNGKKGDQGVRDKSSNRNNKDTKEGRKKQKGKQRGTAAPEMTASPMQ
ncbi:R-spondin-1 [Microcaecilia unicolor]|uniref:R-spondin-1 n=1 Tax=Microcaecilia unicolor TaxID=1415580 RepID=A0A6P7WMU8_9AMPH|nr:R-spondin-1-like [Microcaecilia unicolor]XP_030075772.1 R-spondin-1 [Microcaecilia unicolor]